MCSRTRMGLESSTMESIIATLWLHSCFIPDKAATTDVAADVHLVTNGLAMQVDCIGAGWIVQ